MCNAISPISAHPHEEREGRSEAKRRVHDRLHFLSPYVYADEALAALRMLADDLQWELMEAFDLVGAGRVNEADRPDDYSKRVAAWLERNRSPEK